MKIHLISVGNPQACQGMRQMFLRSQPRLHELCDDPEAADLILVAGNWDRTWGQRPSAVTAHPVIRRYPAKCFAYCEDDRYLPLLPGVYTSATSTLSARLKRVRNYCYISRWRPERSRFIARQEIPKRLLFSFMGAATSEVRTRLYNLSFDRKDLLIEDTSQYSHFDSNPATDQQRSSSQARYAQTIAESQFVLCPAGGGRGSLRFFEAMEAGVCPVLIADGYLIPHGPKWESFLIRVPENRIDELDQILAPLAAESRQRGELAYQAWQTWFAPQVAFNRIVGHCVDLREEQRVGERYFRLLWPWMKAAHFAHYGFKKALKELRKLTRT